MPLDGPEIKMPEVIYSVVCAAHRPDDLLTEAVRTTEAAMAGAAAELIVVANGPQRFEVADAVRSVSVHPFTTVLVSEIQSLVHCLNLGIETARGEYIARMDADDVCIAGRFDRQVERMRSESADFLFSSAIPIDEFGVRADGVLVASASIWRKCGPIHPAVMMRRDAVLRLGGYGNLEVSEDYHLWLRAEVAQMKMVADTEPAILYRQHLAQATARERVARTYATNFGLKLALGLRAGKFSFLSGALYDALCYVYNACRRAF